MVDRSSLRARIAELEAENARWIFRLAEIRGAAGGGGVPMLTELPEAIKDKLEALEARAEKAEASLVEAMGALRVARDFAELEIESRGYAGGEMTDYQDEAQKVFDDCDAIIRRASDVHSRLLEGVSGEGGLSQSQPCRDAKERSHDQQHSDGGRG